MNQGLPELCAGGEISGVQCRTLLYNLQVPCDDYTDFIDRSLDNVRVFHVYCIFLRAAFSALVEWMMYKSRTTTCCSTSFPTIPVAFVFGALRTKSCGSRKRFPWT